MPLGRIAEGLYGHLQGLSVMLPLSAFRNVATSSRYSTQLYELSSNT